MSLPPFLPTHKPVCDNHLWNYHMFWVSRCISLTFLNVTDNKTTTIAVVVYGPRKGVASGLCDTDMGGNHWLNGEWPLSALMCRHPCRSFAGTWRVSRALQTPAIIGFYNGAVPGAIVHDERGPQSLKHSPALRFVTSWGWNLTTLSFWANKTRKWRLLDIRQQRKVNKPWFTNAENYAPLPSVT